MGRGKKSIYNSEVLIIFVEKCWKLVLGVAALFERFKVK